MIRFTAYSILELEKLVGEASRASKTVVLLFTGAKDADGKVSNPLSGVLINNYIFTKIKELVP